jgi:hypothetical protein
MNKNWEKLGIKHLIECHCTLKVYEGKENHLFHKFPVYSEYSENKSIVEKISKCNNCGTLHKVYDICKSEIVRGGKDNNNAEINIDDIALQIDKKIENALRRYDCDISVWEQVLDIIEKEAWKFPVVISREVIEGKYHVKVLEIISDSKLKIFSKTIENEIIL